LGETVAQRSPDLTAVFRPSSIAVVGASDRAGSRGAELLDNLRSIGYPGTVYPINPNRSTVAGRTSFARLSDIGAPIDAVAIGVDADGTRSAVKEAASLGVRAVLVLGTGYAEAGVEGTRLQNEIAEQCRAAGIVLVGPNCLGPWSRLDRVSYWLAPGSPLPLSGIGLVTQSGALASALMEPLGHRGIALDAVATSGNEAGAAVGDFLAHFAQDPRIRVIGLIVESVRQPAQLLAAIRLARAQGKAVVCLLLATSEAGREAAVAHTAALVGDGAVARAFLQEASAILVDDLAELTEHLVLFSHYPRGLRAGLAVTTISGGGSGVIADQAEARGIALARLGPDTLQTIRDLLRGKPVTNPVDVALAGDVPGTYQASVDAVAADPQVGTVAIGLNLPHAAESGGSQFYAGQVTAAGAALAQGKDAVAFAFVPGEPDAFMRTAAENVPVPLLLGVREALQAIANASAYRASTMDTEVATAEGQAGAGTPPTGDPATWDEFEVRAALASYGVPIAAEALVHSAADAGAAAQRIGFPVALKVVATNLTHKSDHGALRLGLTDVGAVRVAYDELTRLAGQIEGVELRGIAVQAMVAPGTELILGARHDAVFGRALVLGWGGLWTEAFPNPRLASVPVAADRAWGLIDGLFAGAAQRARAIVDVESLHAAVLAFSAFVADLPDAVEFVEINPLVLSFGPSGGVHAVDAVVSAFPAPAADPAGEAR
jgi:acyl-CoA synthetase (NDP forming)